MPRGKKVEESVPEKAVEPIVAEDSGPKKEPVVRRKDRLDKLIGSDLMAAILKKHGSSVIRRASEHNASRTQYIPSGIFTLDRALGGGFRVGGAHTVWGPKSSGKTTTLLKTIGTAQKMCSNCWSFSETFDPITGEEYKSPKCSCSKFREVVAALVVTEPAGWDAAWAEALGVDTSALMLSETEYAEQALDIGEALLRSGDVDILAIDSIAFLTPAKEIEKSTVEESMGVQARALGKGIRKFTSALNYVGNHTDRKPTLFLTNQVRFKLGMLFGNPETQPGGQAPQFAATTETKFRNSKVDSEKNKDDSDKVSELGSSKPLSVDISFKVEKNKQGNPLVDGSYNLLLAGTESRNKGDVYDEPVILEQADRFELLNKAGGQWVCLDKEFQSKKELEAHLVANPAFKRKLASQVLELLLVD
jgi:recombination protein RecA